MHFNFASLFFIFALAHGHLFLLVLGYLTLGTSNALSPYTLEPGVPTLLWTGAVAAAGTAYFVVQPRGDGGDRTLTLQAMGTPVIPTTVTANIEQSNDQGASWQPVGSAGTGLALVAASVGTAQVVKNLTAGAIYRINPTTVTLGNATNVVIVGTLS